MNETRKLLDRIAAIRHRLGQAQGMLLEAHCEATQLADQPGTPAHLAAIVAGGERVQALIEGSLRQLAGPNAEPAPLPLTNRARRTAEWCRELVRELRSLSDDPIILAADGESPLTAAWQSAASLAESAVRLMKTLPPEAHEQTRLCDGVDGLLDALADKLGGLRAARDRQALLDERLATLGHWLATLHSGRRLALAPITALAEAVVRDARQGEPLTLESAGTISPAAPGLIASAWRIRHVATHALNAAFVAAQAFESDPSVITLVTALLVADVGMLDVPVELLAQPGALSPVQMCLIERHPVRSAELLASYTDADADLIAGVRQHHERPDGTGYPSGSRQVASLAARMAACGTYAALLADRPHRPSRDPQAALTELLLSAEQGQVDRAAAAALRSLSFFPRGSIVELDDGTLGVVVTPRVDSGPLVALLTDAAGHKLPGPAVTDLASTSRNRVRRALSGSDRRRRLGATFPQFA